MIDIEQEIYKRVVNGLYTSFPKLHTYNVSMPVKAEFPCVTIEEIDNATVADTQDSGSNENHIRVAYETNVYSNKKNGRKAECKQIQSALDAEFLKMGFTRMSSVPFSQNDATLYRIVTRYTAIISKDKTIYGR